MIIYFSVYFQVSQIQHTCEKYLHIYIKILIICLLLILHIKYFTYKLIHRHITNMLMHFFNNVYK